MKKYSNSLKLRQLKRARKRQQRWENTFNRVKLFGLLLIGGCICKAYQKEEGMNFNITRQILPLLTYEQEYGVQNIDYVNDYQVPEWFYEDEGVSAENYVIEDGAETIKAVDSNLDAIKDGENSNQSEKDAQEKEPSIPTLAEDKKAITFTREQLKNREFLLNKIFVVDSNTSMTDDELDINNLLDTKLAIPDLKKWDKKDKKSKILIYHTHASESFIDSKKGNEEDTIVGVGSYLTDLLQQQYGIAVYHDKTAYDMIDGVLDRNKAYENAYKGVKKILEENPSIEVVIDLHRDGVDEDIHLVTEVDGKKTAKIMFLNGVSRSNMNGDIEYLKNPNKKMNLAFSFQMYLKGKEYYNDYVRKIYVRSLRYNMHVMPRTALIEVGAQTNTVQEEKNAMEPLAAIINEVLSDEK